MVYYGSRLSFGHHRNLQSVTIPNNVLVGDNDWSHKFDYMRNLKKINIGGGGTRSSN